jgi:hypothetical protein
MDGVACLEICRTESTASETKLTRVNDQAIRRVLKAAGLEFIDENGGDRACGCGTPRRSKSRERVARSLCDPHRPSAEVGVRRPALKQTPDPAHR